ncbi:MAG: ABC transporter ATP-binding protein [Spirochaetaceae bacterium]|nr:MAG: ABC transporter ATP-binding protein [Spirochaetaceae bacterium]
MELRIAGVDKIYRGPVTALRGVSMTLHPGVIGLLGPNGAGKSTLMRIIATIAQPTAGAVYWNGVDTKRNPDKLRRVLGYLPQDFGVYPNLNPFEFLTFLAAAKGLDTKKSRRRIEELIDAVNLRGVATRPIGRFSGGMRQRVGIAQALLNDPELLIVDEPTVGLDPEERIRFRSMISELSGERVVILSTHIVSDVETTADEIALIARGCLLAYAPAKALVAEVAGKVWGVVLSDEDLAAIRRNYIIVSTTRRNGGVTARVVADGSPHPSAEQLAPTLEDAYMNRVLSYDGGSP